MHLKLFILCLSLCCVRSFPSDGLEKEPAQQIPNSAEHSDDYIAKMADIFELPLEDDRANLVGCVNIMCMPHYLCINDIVVTNGTELVEFRIAPRLSLDEIVCGDMEMPCCADQAIKNLHEVIALEQNDQPEDGKSDDYDQAENTISNQMKCGYRTEGHPATRIIDGNEAQPNEFPWMIGLFLRLRSGNLRYIGGGSLIHSSVILTAAHSLRRIIPENLVVRAGEHDILDTMSDPKRQERNVTNIIVHEDIYVQGLINDIALVVLEKPLELTDAVNTICLPPQSIQTQENIMCTVSGWGKNASDRKGKYQATLRKIELPIVERNKCEVLLRRTRLGPFYNLDDSLMCAGGGRRDTCNGDGGSPLWCEIPNEKHRFYQTGIVAGGIGCGGNIPGLYVNLAHFTDWISHQLGYINLDFEPENVLQYDLFDWVNCELMQMEMSFNGSRVKIRD